MNLSKPKYTDEHAIRLTNGLKFSTEMPKTQQFNVVNKLFASGLKKTWTTLDNMTKTKRKYVVMLDIYIAEIE